MSDATSQAPSLRWGIVGGGMMGLTLALRLAQKGQQVTLFEAAPRIGGLAATWRIADFTWDKHYHVTLLSDEYLRGLLAELDLEDHVRWQETKTGFLTDGKLYSMSNSWEFLRFPPLNLWEKSRLAATILWASRIKNSGDLESVPVADWLERWSGTGAFRKIWLPLLKAKLGDAYRRVSAAFIWTTISRMYRARNSGLKKEMFGYVEGGYATVLDRLREKLEQMGVEIRTSCPVREVGKTDHGTVAVTPLEGDVQELDRVVLTLPSSALDRICPGLKSEEKEQHQRIEYLGIICASMVLERGLADYYVTNITEPNVPFTAVIEMTALVDPAELGGRHLVYLPRYATADDPAWQWTDEQLQEQFLQAVERLYPDFDRAQVAAFEVSRVKQVMALPTLNYSDSLPAIATSVENLFVVNSAQIVKGTLNVNEVIEVAESALEKELLPSLQNHACGSSPAKALEDVTHDQETRELVARS